MTTEEAIDVRKRIGRNIKTLLRDQHKTVRSLVEVLGVSEGQIHARLSGAAATATEELEAIASYLNTTPGELYSVTLDLRRHESRCLHAWAGHQLSFDDIEQTSPLEVVGDLVAA